MITYKKRKKGKVKMKIENVIKELKKGKMLNWKIKLQKR